MVKHSGHWPIETATKEFKWPLGLNHKALGRLVSTRMQRKKSQCKLFPWLACYLCFWTPAQPFPALLSEDTPLHLAHLSLLPRATFLLSPLHPRQNFCFQDVGLSHLRILCSSIKQFILNTEFISNKSVNGLPRWKIFWKKRLPMS